MFSSLLLNFVSQVSSPYNYGSDNEGGKIFTIKSNVAWISLTYDSVLNTFKFVKALIH